MFHCHRQEVPWEVVNSEAIKAVPMFDEDEESDLDIASVDDTDTQGTYVFDIKDSSVDVRRLIVFARRQLRQEMKKRGYNVFLSEGWRMTTYRRGKQKRIEIQYRGRPAQAQGKVPKARPPPFLEILEVPHY